MKLVSDNFSKLVNASSSESSTRWVFLFTAILSNIILWFTWVIVCIIKVEIVDIPMGVWMAYGIANGVTSIAKVVQKNIEEKSKTCVEN